MKEKEAYGLLARYLLDMIDIINERRRNTPTIYCNQLAFLIGLAQLCSFVRQCDSKQELK